MIGENISKLEELQNHFRDFGGTIAKILFWGPEKAKYVFELFLKFIERNSDLEIIDCRKYDPNSTNDLKDNFIVKVGYKCSECKNSVIEEHNLTSGPYRLQGHALVCEFCWDKFQEYAQDAAYEAQAEQEEENKQEALENERQLKAEEQLKEKDSPTKK